MFSSRGAVLFLIRGENDNAVNGMSQIIHIATSLLGEKLDGFTTQEP